MNGKVLGTGIAGARRGDLKQLTGASDSEGGWMGFFTRSDDGAVQAFGEIAPGKYCVLAQNKQLFDIAPPETSH
ncbi:hypothetical protein [Paraburkholderia tropica]|uniref:hypothetical protein n=1 Tax=Paraburkholderia tropica TaxID=92647 RepID=UPI003D2A2E51